MLICVVLLFLVCWGPRFVMEFLLELHLEAFFSPVVYWVRVALFLLPFVHAVVNPIFYLVLSKNIRVAVIKQVGRFPGKSAFDSPCQFADIGPAQ